MILCTRVKQEAEIALGESNLPGIDRPYKQALAEIDRGRGVEAVRDLIRQTEKAISSIRGPARDEGLPGQDVPGDAAEGLTAFSNSPGDPLDSREAGAEAGRGTVPQRPFGPAVTTDLRPALGILRGIGSCLASRPEHRTRSRKRSPASRRRTDLRARDPAVRRSRPTGRASSRVSTVTCRRGAPTSGSSSRSATRCSRRRSPTTSSAGTCPRSFGTSITAGAGPRRSPSSTRSSSRSWSSSPTSSRGRAGALYLQRRPLDFYNRLYGLIEFDRLTFSEPADNPDSNRTNMYFKVGYQYGTPSDERSNAVVGEARDRNFKLFTAYREIGPRGRGLSVAATYGFDYVGGDYPTSRRRSRRCRRSRVPAAPRLVLRLHARLLPLQQAGPGGASTRTSSGDALLDPPVRALQAERPRGTARLPGVRAGDQPGSISRPSTSCRSSPRPPAGSSGCDWGSLYAIGYAGTGNVGNDDVASTETSASTGWTRASGSNRPSPMRHGTGHSWRALLAKTFVTGERGACGFCCRFSTYR